MIWYNSRIIMDSKNDDNRSDQKTSNDSFWISTDDI